MAKPPIINCHTHIFTGDHVPPWLAKSFLPWPLYYLVPVSGVVGFFRWYINKWKRRKFKGPAKLRLRWLYNLGTFLRQSGLYLLLMALGFWLTLHSLFVLVACASHIISLGKMGNYIFALRDRLIEHHVIFLPASRVWRLVIVILTFTFFQSGRNLIIFLGRLLLHLPGPQTKALIQRYILLGRFSFHRSQAVNYSDLRRQYPPGTGFVVLPMDMEYMGAGSLKPEFKYRAQMQELANMKANSEYKDFLFPFLFADPRRIKDEADYFKYKLVNGNIELDNCFVKDYIEGKRFSGFKIYPALGYYPFDPLLLPIWKYAADNAIPVLTHCIRGNIFWRGPKKKEWGYHPIFEESTGTGVFQDLLLSERKNIDFINNFTHPMNFLCLLKEPLLRKVVGKSRNVSLKEIFGYTAPEVPMEQNLEHLKVCFGHYGGEDEWARFLESDRDDYTPQLILRPDRGFEFLSDSDGFEKPGNPEKIWRDTDWYSIISSMMLQHDHVYSDLSFIVHNTAIQPLLVQTLRNEKLRQRVLFGTDFYVVRNYKTEKQLLAEMMDLLPEADFDQIARINPREFLANYLHGPLAI